MNTKDLDAKIEYILRKQEEISQDIETLNDLVKRNQEESSGLAVWEPERNEPYYVVNTNGEVGRLFNNSTFDESTIKHTRVFKTKEEAEFEAERMKVLRELEKFASEFEYDFDLPGGNHYIYYDCDLNQLLVGETSFKCHELCFESEEKAKEAIRSVGEYRVKKYYLGVKYN